MNLTQILCLLMEELSVRYLFLVPIVLLLLIVGVCWCFFVRSEWLKRAWTTDIRYRT